MRSLDQSILVLVIGKSAHLGQLACLETIVHPNRHSDFSKFRDLKAKNCIRAIELDIRAIRTPTTLSSFECFEDICFGVYLPTCLVRPALTNL
jgi:hypothetical protein